jgi:hypothetical protein
MLKQRWQETELPNLNIKITTEYSKNYFSIKHNREKNLYRLILINTKNLTSNGTMSFWPLKKKMLKHLESLNRHILEIKSNRQLLDDKFPLKFKFSAKHLNLQKI